MNLSYEIVTLFCSNCQAEVRTLLSLLNSFPLRQRAFNCDWWDVWVCSGVVLKCCESAYCTDNYNGGLAVQNAVNQQCRVGAWQSGASLSWHSRKKSQRNSSIGTQWKQGKLAKMWSSPCFVRREGKDSKEVVSVIFFVLFWGRTFCDFLYRHFICDWFQHMACFGVCF